MSAPEETKGNNGFEARLSGWTNTEFWFNRTEAGASGGPILVKDGAALLPGDIYVSFLSEHVTGSQYPGGGMVFLGRGANHYLGTIEDADFSVLGSGFVPYGMRLSSEDSQTVLSGNYYGLLGHPAQVFLGDRKLPGFFPVAVTKEGVLLCYDTTQTGNPQEVIDKLIASHRGEISESFPHLARIMNRPPAEQSFALVGEAAQEAGQWLKSTQGRLCQPSGIAVDLPANPLDLIKQVHLMSVTEVDNPLPLLPAVVALPAGTAAVFYPGKNQAILEYVLDRTKDGSLQGSFKYGADFHLGAVAAPHGFSLAGDIDFHSFIEGSFAPIKTLSKLFSVLLKNPANLIEKITEATQIKIHGPLKMTLPDSKDQVTLKPGDRDAIFKYLVTTEKKAGQVVEFTIQVAAACWDFAGIQISSVQDEIPGVVKGCFTTDPAHVSESKLGTEKISPGVIITAKFDGNHLVSLDLRFHGRVIDAALPTYISGEAYGFYGVLYSGQITGHLRFGNIQKQAGGPPILAFVKGSELRLFNGKLTMNKKDVIGDTYTIPPAGAVSIDLETDAGGGFHVSSQKLLSFDGLDASLDAKVGFVDANGKAVGWEQFGEGKEAFSYLPSAKIQDHLLQVILTVVKQGVPNPPDTSMTYFWAPQELLPKITLPTSDAQPWYDEFRNKFSDPSTIEKK